MNGFNSSRVSQIEWRLRSDPHVDFAKERHLRKYF